MSSGDMRFQWGTCTCDSARTNPAAEPPLQAITALYDELGRAVAIGELADRLGLEDGARLVQGVAQFVAGSPTVLRTVAETGGVVSSVATGLTGAAAKAWTVVLAGGGAKGGLTYGQTDLDGKTVKDNPVSEGDLFATIYTALGISPKAKHFVGSRPVWAAPPESKVVKELLS